MHTLSNKWNGTGLPPLNSFIRLVSCGHTEIKSAVCSRILNSNFKFGQLCEVTKTDNNWFGTDGILSVRLKNPNEGTVMWAVLDDFQLQNSATVKQSNKFKKDDVAIAKCIMTFDTDGINYMEIDGVEIGKRYIIESWMSHYACDIKNGPAVKISMNGCKSKWLPADAFEKSGFVDDASRYQAETKPSEHYDPANLRVVPVKIEAIYQNPKVTITALERINVPITNSYEANNIPMNSVSQNRISIF